LALVVEGPRKEQIEGARAQVEQARAGLQLTEASRLELKRLEQESQTRRAQVAQARAQVAVVEAQLADAVVTAPVNGVVLVKSAEAGEVLAPGATFLTIGEMERPWLRAYISETDLGRVKLGAKVKVTTDSYPGKVYWGKISFISSEAEFTPKQIQETGDRSQESGDRRQETGVRSQETGVRSQETGDRRPKSEEMPAKESGVS
jgi:HlyD family secretion protein